MGQDEEIPKEIEQEFNAKFKEEKEVISIILSSIKAEPSNEGVEESKNEEMLEEIPEDYNNPDEYDVEEPTERSPSPRIEAIYFTTPVESVKTPRHQGTKLYDIVPNPFYDMSKEEEETSEKDLSAITKAVDSKYIIIDEVNEEKNIQQKKGQAKVEKVPLSDSPSSREESKKNSKKDELTSRLDKQYPADTTHIRIERQIGGEEQRKVHLGYIRGVNEPIVIKQFIIKADEENLEKMVEMLVKEVEMIRSFNNPNIVKYLKFHRSNFDKSSNKLEYNIIMEYMSGGSLADLLKSNGRGLTKPLIQDILRQILNGLKYLHEQKVIHRNLMPSNILVNKNKDRYKITDFSLAARVKEQLPNAKRSCAGTPWYIAPEVILGNPYCYPADIWSFGCLAFELFSGKKLYDTCNGLVAMVKMIKNTSPYEDFPKHLLEKLKTREWSDFLNLLQSCWKHNPTQRPTAAKLLDHPFLKKMLSPKKQNKAFPKVLSKPVIRRLNIGPLKPPRPPKTVLKKVKQGIQTPHNKVFLTKKF